MSLFELATERRQPQFSDFIQSERLKPAWLAARACAAGTASAFLFGGPGTGKTHLVNAARHAATINKVALLSLEMDDFENGLLTIDDVHELSEDSQQALYRFLNSHSQRADQRLQALVASPVPAPQLQLRDDVSTRLEMLPAFALHQLTDEQLQRALLSHALRLGRALAPEVARVLVQMLPRDLGTLVAALDKLDAHAVENDRKLSGAEARRWLVADKLTP